MTAMIILLSSLDAASESSGSRVEVELEYDESRTTIPTGTSYATYMLQ